MSHPLWYNTIMMIEITSPDPKVAELVAFEMIERIKNAKTPLETQQIIAETVAKTSKPTLETQRDEGATL